MSRFWLLAASQARAEDPEELVVLEKRRRGLVDRAVGARNVESS